MFDPYLEWLAIPTTDRPPTHYQLLGLDPRERDPQVVEQALLDRVEQVRVHQTGPYAEECAQILTELAWAGEVLLDPKRRAAYDRDLLLRRTPALDARPQSRGSVRIPAWAVALIAIPLSFPLAVILSFVIIRYRQPPTPNPDPSPPVAAQQDQQPPAAPPAKEAGEVTDDSGAKPAEEARARVEETASNKPGDSAADAKKEVSAAVPPPADGPKVDAQPPVDGAAKVEPKPAAKEPVERPEPPEAVAQPAPEPALAKVDPIAPPPPPQPGIQLEDPVKPDLLPLDPLTEKTLGFILDQEWDSLRHDVVKRVRSTVTETYRAKGDMLLVNFAHGLFLAKRMQWKDAQRAYEQALRRDEHFAPAWIGRSVAEFQQNDVTAALQSLANAANEKTLSSLTIDSIAVVDGFYASDPDLTLLQRRKLESLISDLQKRMDPDQQRRYRTMFNATVEYKKSLPEQKLRLMERLAPQQQRLSEYESALNAASRELAAYQAEFDDLLQRARRLQTTASQVAASYDLQIRSALMNDNPELAQRLQQQKNLALATYEAQYKQLDNEAAAVRRTIEPLRQKLMQLETRYRELASQLQVASESLDKAMTRPPIPFDVETQRKRLLEKRQPGNDDLPTLQVPAFVLPEIPLDPARS